MSLVRRWLAGLLLCLMAGAASAAVDATWTHTGTLGCSTPITRTFTGTLQTIQLSWLNTQGLWGCANTYTAGEIRAYQGSFKIVGTPAGTFWLYPTQVSCPAGTTFVPATGMCQTADECTSKASIGSKSYYDAGTSPTSFSINRVACVSGCTATWTGDYPVKSFLLAGVRHYVGYGQYMYTGDGIGCTVGTAGAVAVTAGESSGFVSTCAAGQYSITLNGVSKCYDSSNAPVAETASVPTKTVTNNTVTNADNSKTVTTTITNNQTNVTTSSTTTYAAGVTPPTLPATQTLPLDSSAASDSSGGSDMAKFCQSNPTASVCQSITSGTGAATSGLYTADATGKTFSGSLTTFKTTVSGAGIVSAAGNFFTAGTITGACTGVSVSYNLLGQDFTLNATEALCGANALTYYGYLALGLLIAATGIAFAIAIL